MICVVKLNLFINLVIYYEVELAFPIDTRFIFPEARPNGSEGLTIRIAFPYNYVLERERVHSVISSKSHDLEGLFNGYDIDAEDVAETRFISSRSSYDDEVRGSTTRLLLSAQLPKSHTKFGLKASRTKDASLDPKMPRAKQWTVGDDHYELRLRPEVHPSVFLVVRMVIGYSLYRMLDVETRTISPKHLKSSSGSLQNLTRKALSKNVGKESVVLTDELTGLIADAIGHELHFIGRDLADPLFAANPQGADARELDSLGVRRLYNEANRYFGFDSKKDGVEEDTAMALTVILRYAKRATLVVWQRILANPYTLFVSRGERKAWATNVLDTSAGVVSLTFGGALQALRRQRVEKFSGLHDIVSSATATTALKSIMAGSLLAPLKPKDIAGGLFGKVIEDPFSDSAVSYRNFERRNLHLFSSVAGNVKLVRASEMGDGPYEEGQMVVAAGQPHTVQQETRPFAVKLDLDLEAQPVMTRKECKKLCLDQPDCQAVSFTVLPPRLRNTARMGGSSGASSHGSSRSSSDKMVRINSKDLLNDPDAFRQFVEDVEELSKVQNFVKSRGKGTSRAELNRDLV